MISSRGLRSAIGPGANRGVLRPPSIALVLYDPSIIVAERMSAFGRNAPKPVSQLSAALPSGATFPVRRGIRSRKSWFG